MIWLKKKEKKPSLTMDRLVLPITVSLLLLHVVVSFIWLRLIPRLNQTYIFAQTRTGVHLLYCTISSDPLKYGVFCLVAVSKAMVLHEQETPVRNPPFINRLKTVSIYRTTLKSRRHIAREQPILFLAVL